MGEKRSRYEIFVAILEVTKGGANVTKIVYGANINFKMAQDYLKYLVDNEFVVLTSKNGKNTHTTTDKGRDFLKKYGELEEMTE